MVPCDGARDAQIGGGSICRSASRASCKLVFSPSVSRRSALRKVSGRLNLRHDLRAWSSLRLDPKLPRRAVPDGLAGEIDWLRVDPARDSLFCFQPFLLFLILSLSSFVSPFSSRARPSSYLPLPLHFTSSRHLSRSYITPAVFTSSLHITSPPSTSLS